MSEDLDGIRDEPQDLDPMLDAGYDEADEIDPAQEIAAQRTTATDEHEAGAAAPGGEAPREPEPYPTQPRTTEVSRKAIERVEELQDQMGATPPIEPRFKTVDEFVEWLVEWYRRRISGTSGAWCPEWWQHPEALLRFDSLHRAYEHLRQDEATGVAVWIRDYADPFMGVLLASDGPFNGCSPQDGHGSHPLNPLPLEPRPTENGDASPGPRLDASLAGGAR